MEAGVVELIGIEDEERDGYGGQQVQQAAAAVEEFGDEEQREASGRPDHRRLPAGDERVEPGACGGDEQCVVFRDEAHSQQEQQGGG